MRRVAAALDNSTFAASVAEAFHTRIQVFTDQMVAGHVGKYKMLLRNRDKAGAGDLVKQVSAIIDYAGPEAKLEWQSILAQTGKTGLLSRLRK
jgi:hypothetical protein